MWEEVIGGECENDQRRGISEPNVVEAESREYSLDCSTVVGVGVVSGYGWLMCVSRRTLCSGVGLIGRPNRDSEAGGVVSPLSNIASSADPCGDAGREGFRDQSRCSP